MYLENRVSFNYIVPIVVFFLHLYNDLLGRLQTSTPDFDRYCNSGLPMEEINRDQQTPPMPPNIIAIPPRISIF